MSVVVVVADVAVVVVVMLVVVVMVVVVVATLAVVVVWEWVLGSRSERSNLEWVGAAVSILSSHRDRSTSCPTSTSSGAAS